MPCVRIEERLPVSFSVRCQHCDEAPCVDACVSGALTREFNSGVVTFDKDKCVGCWMCVITCPLGAIRCDAGQHRIVKCDLCPGEDTPACVAGCPNEALVYVEA